MTTWYATETGSANQALVIDEETGRNVAVVYDAKDAKLLAIAPKMLEALSKSIEEFEFMRENVTMSTRLNKVYKPDPDILNEIWSIFAELNEL